MTRLLALAITCLLGREACSQGIYGVTRRSPALEKQTTARRFFDAAGLNVTGANPTADGNPSAFSPVAVPAGAGTVLSANPMAPRVAHPLVLRPAGPTPPILSPGTNRAIVRKLPAPPSSRAKP